MGATRDDDVEDIRRVLTGDAGAFAGLVARHARRCHDVARRMLRDAQEAEDIVQHAFMNAYKALDRFDTDRPFRHWILRITTNLCRNRIAWKKTRAHELAARGGDETLPVPASASATPPPGDDEGDRARIRAAIESLPERYRLAVVLRYVHDMSLEAISEATGVPMATVKTHLHRGRAALRARLAGETRDPEPGTEA